MGYVWRRKIPAFWDNGKNWQQKNFFGTYKKRRANALPLDISSSLQQAYRIDGIGRRCGKGKDDQKGDRADGKSRRISPQAKARMYLQCSDCDRENGKRDRAYPEKGGKT